MAIETEVPVSIPAQTFNLVRFPVIEIMWPDPNQPIGARYVMRKYLVDPLTTVAADAPIGDVTGEIGDLYTEAAVEAGNGNTDLAQAIGLILSYLERRERAKGNI